MARAFCSFGAAALFAAFVLQFLVSISLPYLPALDIVRVNFASGTVSVGHLEGSTSQLRLGIWAYCQANVKAGDTACEHTGRHYSVDIKSPQNNQIVTVKSSWTNGLAVHPIATGVIFIAFLISLSMHPTVVLLTSMVSFFAALMTLIVFAIDIALLALTKLEVDKLAGVRADADAGPGFWVTLATFLLLLIAGCTVCFGRRHDRRSAIPTKTNGEKSSFWRRLRRTTS